MTGGLRETASRLAIAAMFCVMGTAVFGTKPVYAADLGGDCCADLEERVAELEATTVRKGNKKVSVQVYGKVNKAVEYWDDGAEQNTYVVDNSYETTRMGFKGTAKISGNWGAGYKLEFETRDASSEALNQIDDDNTPQARGVFVRHSYMFVNNKDLGEVRWGLTYTPKDDVTKDTNVTDLQDTMNSDDHMNRGFFLRPKGFNTEVGGAGQLKWQNISGCYTSGAAFDCSTRRNQVTYWSPDWNGLTASWGWGEDDIWGAALRYKKDWQNFKVGAGVGYEDFTDERLQAGGGGLANFKRDIQEWAGSGSIKHKPTGLFVFGAWSLSQNDDTNRQNAGIFTHTSSPDMNAWDAQIGIQRPMPWFGLDKLGETSFFGGFTNISDGIGGAGGPTRFLPAGTFPNLAVGTEITGAEVDKWYLGFDQAIDSAAMHLYAVYQHLDPSVDLVDSSLNSVSEPLDNFDLFYTGARIYF
jgi:predicted porin